MWVVFEPVKKREILEKIVLAFPKQSKIVAVEDGWKLYLKVGKKAGGGRRYEGYY